MLSTLDFEKPVHELEKKITELRQLSSGGNLNLESEVKKLEGRLLHLKKETYEHLTAWQRVQIARHPRRPYTLDYVNRLFMDFTPLHGDRVFADDKAMVGGMARFEGQTVLVLGHQKGRDAKENIMRNFGSAHPEGYRKAIRLMKLAEKFGVPVICFVDTPGAYPGVGAEERGQAYTIAYNIREMARLAVPVLIYVIGEGGSGGALGIGVGDHVAVLENAYYSVISPEGCAAILWKDRTKAPEAATALKLTARDLLDMKLIDEMIREPLGGAHHDPEFAAEGIRVSIKKHLGHYAAMETADRTGRRYEKFRRMGAFDDSSSEKPVPSKSTTAPRVARRRHEKRISHPE